MMTPRDIAMALLIFWAAFASILFFRYFL